MGQRSGRAFRLLPLLPLVIAGAACKVSPDGPADFVSAVDLCVGALSGEADRTGAIEAAGWEVDKTGAPGSAAQASNRYYAKGSLSLVLANPGQDRCIVDGSPGTVGSLAEVTDALSSNLGRATKETHGSYRWNIAASGLIAKVSQTNTERGEVVRLYVFRPNLKLIEGIGPDA